jgi:uncharacterized protein
MLSEQRDQKETWITEVVEKELNSPRMIGGFVGAGLVGAIAANHIVDQMDMEQIAFVKSKYLPPAAVFTEGSLRHPFRIYSNVEGTLCVMLCEVPLKSEGLYSIASTVVDWAQSKGVEEIVVLEGFPVKNLPKERKSFCAAEEQKCKELEKVGIETLKRGLIGGIAGSVLNECMTNQIIGVSLVTPGMAYAPDPEGAAQLLNSVNDAYGLNVDTSELLDRAEDIKRRLKEIAQKYRQATRSEKKREVPESLYG